MESSGRFEQLFFKVLKENNTGEALGPEGGYNNQDDARIPKLLGQGKVQTRKGSTGGKKNKKKKTDGLDGVYLTGEDEEAYDEDAERVDKDRMKCNSPRRTSGGSKKFVVKACKDGKEKIVRFGDPNMKIKKSNPKRRKSFRARHKCDQKKDKFSAGYWSCKKW